MKKYINDLTIEDLEKYLDNINEKKFRAKQIFKWVHSGINSFDEMTDISLELREKLSNEFELCILNILDKQVSIDGTTKYLFELRDKNTIESVVMKYNYGNSICISTQIGCKMGCKFCASSKIGFIRDLTSGEIEAQVFTAMKDMNESISNIVYMGIGEPFDNYENVLRSIKIINHHLGLNIGGRHISVSTSGIVPKILELSKEKLQCTLSISLHAPNDEIRSQMMPINNKYNISQVINACKEYIKVTNRRITFEYAMVNGVNDSLNEAKQLCKILKGMLCHVNLIPINKIKDGEYKKASNENVLKFRDYLNNNGITATVRRELGSDIEAACGQLRRNRLDKEG